MCVGNFEAEIELDCDTYEVVGFSFFSEKRSATFTRQVGFFLLCTFEAEVIYFIFLGCLLEKREIEHEVV